jgi:hypothetical protein
MRMVRESANGDVVKTYFVDFSSFCANLVRQAYCPQCIEASTLAVGGILTHTRAAAIAGS